MSYQAVDDINRIDLTRHGLIEASAGTGKTYTIENLVVRLLREREEVEMENILVVTFTEKAASELKARIRKKIEEDLEEGGDEKEGGPAKLRQALDSFDRAPIHTIHGFCQTVLRDFAFENRVLFQTEVISDRPLFEALLKEQMRKDWPLIYGDHLEELLYISGFHDNPGSFMDTVVRLAQTLHPEAGDLLIPDPWGSGPEGLAREIAGICMEIKALIGPGGEFSKGYAQLRFNKRSKTTVLANLVDPLEEFFSGFKEEGLHIPSLLDLMTSVENTRSAGRKGLDCLIPARWNKGGQNLEACPADLAALKQRLEALKLKLNSLGQILPAQTIHRLQEEVRRTKQARGWISYYDMLSLVERALSDDSSGELLKRLRNRYRVAFIDEFQDTDPVQWRIFRKIFMDNDQGAEGNLLFVIGDPKQAIYSFRGADVYAYLDARNHMETLAGRDRARLYSLSVNWRSLPPLIGVFNRLFCNRFWFRPQKQVGELEIGYLDTEPPGTKEGIAEMIQDDSGRPVLNIVDLSRARSPVPAKRLLAGFVASEIRHLVSSRIDVRERGRGERRLGFGDICVLVRSQSDVPFAEEGLAGHGIPYSFYRKPGLFLADEAVYVGLLFHAILEPGDGSAVKKALLTPFFGFRPDSLFSYEEMPPSHPVKELLFRWHGYAIKRMWSRLFQSMIEESGLLARRAGGHGWDREYTNYRQIFEYLEGMAYGRNLDFRGLSALLDTLRKRSLEPGEGEDIHQIETEARKVQIMTMHVSKGLQFPIVFVAGGLTRPPSHMEQYHTYHRVEGDGSSRQIRRIVDLSRSGGDGRHESEKIDEDKRLYYVACTRAQFKLYLPYYPHGGEASYLGPVCTRLSPALSEAFSHGEDEDDLLWIRAEPGPGPTPALTAHQVVTGGGTVPVKEAFERLRLRESYKERRIRLDSFSSLSRRISSGEAGRGEAPPFQTEGVGREDDEGFVPPLMEALSAEEDPHWVPGGIETGLMFHDILEQIDYRVVLDAITLGRDPGLGLMEDRAAAELVRRYMEAHLIDLRWFHSVCRIVGNTLATPLAPVADGFVLARLREEDRLHEAEFYYAFPSNQIAPGSIPGCRITSRYVRGFVDLIFRVDGKFYLADWKSNLLETGYDRQSMEESMAHSGYHLQYRLYAVAVLRWLKQTLGESFDPERDFGGVFYFYLRGMGGDGGGGIYFVTPGELGSLEQLEQEIAMMLETGPA